LPTLKLPTPEVDDSGTVRLGSSTIAAEFRS
jgi:hypothetical protein